MAKRFKILGVVTLIVVAVLAITTLLWVRVSTYPAFPNIAEQARTFESSEGWLEIEPQGEIRAGLILYPGALVDPAAYIPFAQLLGDRGVLVVIVPMPLNLAVLGIDRATDVMNQYPEIETWVIGGHSLGGAMAAEYVGRSADRVDGLVLLAAYPSESTDLSQIPIAVTSIFGTRDAIAEDVYDKSRSLLPPDTYWVEIIGGNHAQFGDYGPQKGDGEATMSRYEQQEKSALAVISMVDSLR